MLIYIQYAVLAVLAVLFFGAVLAAGAMARTQDWALDSGDIDE